MTHSGPSTPPGEDDTDLLIARRVLRTEAAALEALAEALNGPFVAALDILERAKGRVVVTGMGKSGHVGRKIAATLASTGTPAFFVHPAEASHGDLGMITQDDVLLALSNSGETAELSAIIDYSRRFSLPLIGITSRPGSTLHQTSDVTLLLPAAPEACPLGLAPTTSTTLMLALGDALAVALLERKGFSAEDFHGFHPGGKLGSRLLRVQDLMHSGDALPLVPADLPMSEALLIMTRKSFGCVGVVEDGKLSGIVTDGDLRRHMSGDLLNKTARDIMTANPKTVRPGQLATEAVAIMNAKTITSLLVIDGERKPVGILHIHDCLRAGVL